MSTSPFYDSILKGTWAIENGKFVHPISKKTYTLDEYREIAYTPDAVQWRDENKDRIAFINTEGSMDKVSRSKIWDIIGSYKSDAGEDLTAAAAAFTVKKLVDQGITNLNQISIEYIPAYAGQVEEVQDGYGGVTEQVVGASPERFVYRNKTTGAIVNPVIFADGAGTTIALQPNGSNGNYTLGMAKNYSQFDKLVSQLAEYVDPNSTGGAWGTKAGRNSPPGFGPEGMLRQLAQRFINATGLTDLNKLGYGKITTPDKNQPVVRQPIYDSDYEVTGYQWVTPTADFATDENGFLVAGGYRGLSPEEIKTIKDVGNGRYTADVVVGREGYYNKDTGTNINFNGDLGGWGEGPGITHASLRIGENGKPVVSTHGEDTGFDPMLLGIIITVATFGVGGPAAIGAFITGGAATGVAAVAVGSAAVSFATNIAMGVPPLKALENSIKSAGAAYVGQMVGAMLPQELSAVGSSAVKQIIQTGKIDLAQLAIAGASGLAADAIAAETGLSKDLAGTLAGAGMAVLTGKEKAAIEMLQNAAVRTVFNSFAAESGLTQQEKNFLQLGVGQLLNVAKGGKFNPISLVNDMMNMGMSQAAAAKVVGQNVPNDQRSQTAVGAVSSDSSGNLYSTDDDGNRLVLTGTDAGRIYTAAEWNGIQAALNAGQAQFVSAVIKNMNDGVFTPEEAQQELKDAGYSAAQIQKVIDANQQYITRAANAKSIIQEYTTAGSGYDRATALAALQRDAGYSAEDAEKVLGNLDTNLRNQRSVGQFINAYAEPGSDVSREAVINQLKGLTINGQRQYSDADIEKIVGDADKVTTARNNYANITRDFLTGAATEKQLTDAMDAAGITGQARTDQLTYYRAIKAGSELTSSEATQAAVAGLNTWNLIPDRKGTQVVFALNDEGSPYVKEARDSQGRDVTNLFYGSSPQALQQYVTQENQKYADRMKSTLTRTAESFFAPGGTMSNDQAITALKATGLTDAMARDVVAGWSSQKEAVGRNVLNIDQANRTTSRMLSFEEFERMLGAVNVKDKLTERYQAYVTTNNAFYSLGKLPNGQFLFPGEVTGALDRAAAIKELPRNSTVDQIAQEVYKGVAAGSAVGSSAQNLINSLNANFLALFPRVGAGITSVVMGDAANETAVILRGLAEIGSKSSDMLMPDLAAEANRRMADISNADGFVNKMVKAWDWATSSPLSFGSLAWTAGKELSEDMVSFALLGKALQVVGSAPGKALGLAFTDLALNYGGISEENIAELIQQGLDPKLAAQLAGQGAMPAALAETIVGTVFSAIPLDKITKNSAFRNLIATPYHANIDGVEEGASYLANQIGMGKPVELNDALTSYVIGSTVGGKANVITSVGDMLTGQGQGDLLRSIDEAGLKTGIDASIIPDDAKATVLSVTNDIAVVKMPSGGTYLLDVSNQDLKPNDVINIKAFDNTAPGSDFENPDNLTEEQTKQLVTDVTSTFKRETGQDLTFEQLAPNLNQFAGKSQTEITQIIKETPEAQVYTRIKSVFEETLGRNPTESEVTTVLNLGTELTDKKIETFAESLPEYSTRQVSISTSKSLSASVSLSLSTSQSVSEATSISVSNSISESQSISEKIASDALKAASVSRSISSSISSSLSLSTSASLQRAADEVATQDWLAPDGKTYQIPKLWGEYTEAQKIKWFNDNGWNAPKLQSMGISNDDITYLVGKGLTKDTWKTTEELAAEAEAQRISTSNSISLSLSLSASTSQSISQSTSLSTSSSLSESTSLSIAISEDILRAASVSRSVSISQSTSSSLSQSVSISNSISEANSISVSKIASTSLSISQSQSVSSEEIARSISESISISNKIKEDAAKAVSVSKSISESQSISASISESTSTSQSISASTSQSLSTVASISTSQFLSTSLSQSVSESLSISKSLSPSISASISESLAMARSTSLSLSKSVSISEKLKNLDESQRLSLSNSISISDSLSQSASISVGQSISQSISQTISQSISSSTSQSLSTTINPSITVTQSTAISESISTTINPSISVSQSVSTTVEPTVPVTTPINPSVTVTVTETPTVTTTVTFSPTLVITTPTPTVTVTESFELTTLSPTIPWPPTLSFTETTSMPVTTTEAPTTTKPVTTKPVTTKPVTTKPGPTTKPPPFPLFMVPGYDQTKRYIDYAQPNVPAPQFGPYDPFKAPNYLRPLQDAGNFGIAALVGAFNDGKPGNGGNQPK